MSMPPYSLTDVLASRWWIGVVALAVSLVATPVMRFVAYRTGIVDRPDELLKPHGRPIAYLGGVAMCIGLLAGLASFIAVMPNIAEHWRRLGAALAAVDLTDLWSNPLWTVLGIAVASVVITLVGLVDDLRSISPRNKILGQVLAAGVLMAGGVGIVLARSFLAIVAPDAPLWLVLPLSGLVCLVLVIGACNAANLLDGLDGLCGGVTAIIAIGFLALAVWLAAWGRAPEHDAIRVALCLAMVGAVLGFLPYNVPPASIFMGDAGSMLLGFFVATMLIMFGYETTPRFFLAAVVIFALPICDTGLAVVRRLRAGRSIFAGDRSHLYDQLVDRGMSVKQVVGLFYLLATVAATVGVAAAVLLRIRHAVVLYAVLFLAVWVVFALKGMISPPQRQPAPPQREHEHESR